MRIDWVRKLEAWLPEQRANVTCTQEMDGRWSVHIKHADGGTFATVALDEADCASAVEAHFRGE